MQRHLLSLLYFAAALAGHAQFASLRSAPTVHLPPVIDGNTSAMWADGEMYIFHSTGEPHRSKGMDQFTLGQTEKIEFLSEAHKPVWFEAVWKDTDGTLFLWYHNEPGGVCQGNSLTAPRIGAAVSYDNGKTIEDLGIILETGDALECGAANGFFAGGHGDFSVIPDRENGYFYFYFTNYNGNLEEQGVATARMAFGDRFQPAGTVNKYYAGEWSEPGLGGHMSPIFPAKIPWKQSDANSFWGPSIHWNSHLGKYVILINQVCCTPGWPQVGVYVSYAADLANPAEWTNPALLIAGWQIPYGPGYYPQVLGTQPGETDSLASEVARLYIQGSSDWEIVFRLSPPDFEGPEACSEAPSASCPDPE